MMGKATELIFVDGNSDDGTREEIQAVIAEYRPGPLKLVLVDQGNGKGKGDAVRKGFATLAKEEVLMILDSDLTVPPEDLPKFYRALVARQGRVHQRGAPRLPDGGARRCASSTSSATSSSRSRSPWLLEQPIKDSLCGTKVLYRKDYDRIADNRAYFGDFDPFGDFDLLFGGAPIST